MTTFIILLLIALLLFILFKPHGPRCERCGEHNGETSHYHLGQTQSVKWCKRCAQAEGAKWVSGDDPKW
jgi:hypothetical protein